MKPVAAVGVPASSASFISVSPPACPFCCTGAGAGAAAGAAAGVALSPFSLRSSCVGSYAYPRGDGAAGAAAVAAGVTDMDPRGGSTGAPFNGGLGAILCGVACGGWGYWLLENCGVVLLADASGFTGSGYGGCDAPAAEGEIAVPAAPVEEGGGVAFCRWPRLERSGFSCGCGVTS